MSVDFIVLGLPRSGTTWLSSWLTTDRSLCLHDPFSRTLPEHWDAGGRRLGIACTGAYMLPGWLGQQDAPTAIIQRDHAACDASLAAMGLPATTERMRCLLSVADGRRWQFSDIWNEDKARELWAFLLPGIAFDAPRYRLLRNMQIQPKEWTADLDVMAAAFAQYS
jgi:hypothetical protein